MIYFPLTADASRTTYYVRENQDKRLDLYIIDTVSIKLNIMRVRD